MIVPIDSRYGAYQTMRGPVALAGLAAAGRHAAATACIRRSTNVQRLYNQQPRGAGLQRRHAGAADDEGDARTTRTLPRNLYSHSDQTQQWQSSDPNGGGTGWGGRINDLIAGTEHRRAAAGHHRERRQRAVPVGADHQGHELLERRTRSGSTTFGDGTAMDGAARLAAAAADVRQRPEAGERRQRRAGRLDPVGAGDQRRARTARRRCRSRSPTAASASSSRRWRRSSSVRGALGMNRQIFFAGMGGFDNHEDLVNKHAGADGRRSTPRSARSSRRSKRGACMNQVTLFTESEFNRTGNANANIGTDHAWGGHHLVLGGAVHGGQTYGTFPTHELRGPDDAGDRGNWIPTTSLDQYAATLGGWFGVSDADL